MTVRSSSESILSYSALLSTFPWLTDFLIDGTQAIHSSDRFQPFFNSLSAFGRDMTYPATLEAHDLRSALSIAVSSSVMPSELPEMGSRVTVKMCQMLSAFKLSDVLHALHTSSPLIGRNPRYRRMTYIGITQADRAWPMTDWVKTLLSAKAYASAARTKFLDAPSSTPSSLQAKLIRDLHLLSTKHSGVKILFNIQMAAIHLFFILQGFRPASSQLLPDMPGSSTELTKSDDPSNELPGDQAEFVRSLMGTADAQKRKYPLYAAAFISPLVLLCDKKLTSRCLGHLDLMKACKALGNCKSQLLVSIELKMWSALLSIAMDGCSAFTAIQNFLTTVPWDELLLLPETDRAFFLPDTDLISRPISLLSCETESDVHKDWLLADLRQLSSSSPSASHMPSSAASHTLLHAESIDKMDTGTGEATDQAEIGSARTMEAGVPGTEPLFLPDMDTTEDSSPSIVEPPNTSIEASTNSSELPTTYEQDLSMDVSPWKNDAGRIPVDPARKDHTILGTSHTKRTGITPSASSDDGEEELSAAEQPVPDSNSQRKTGKPARQLRRRKADKGKGTSHATARPQGSVEYSPFERIGAVSYLEVVDLDAYVNVHDITFKASSNKRRISGDDVTLYGPPGVEMRWKPEFHFKADLTSFNNFRKYTELFYINHKPRHISAPSKSSFAMIEYKDYKTMSSSTIQSLLRTKHLIVTSYPYRSIAFDKRGLKTLTNMDANISIQDQSIDATDGLYRRQMVIGTLSQMLEASRLPSGPILNALSFPLPLTGVSWTPLSSEVEAWRSTVGQLFCPSEAQFPVGDIRWGLAATKGARHWIHIDSDGFGTYLDVQCGGKWWITFNPPAEKDKAAFADVFQFLDNFETNAEDGSYWALAAQNNETTAWIAEAIYLSPGTRLIMKPNTPHAVFTTADCISYGGHFYSISNLQDTFFGIVHCFMADDLITNTEHPRARQLLRRMMQYFYKGFMQSGADITSHFPNLIDPNSMLDVLTLCNYCILSNVLDSRTYSFPGSNSSVAPSDEDYMKRVMWDYNEMSTLDREHSTYVRGLARNLLRWISCHYDVTFEHSTDPTPNVMKNVCIQYLVEQACAILNYKKQAEDKKIVGLPYCLLKDVERQLDLVLRDEEAEAWMENKATFQEHNNLSFGDISFTVAEKDRPLAFTERDCMKIGKSEGDRLFLKGRSLHFPITTRPTAETVAELSDNDGSHISATPRKRPVKRPRK